MKSATSRQVIMGPVTLFLAAVMNAQTASPVSPVYLPGEELQYCVRWKFLRLGTIIVRTAPGPADSSGRKTRVSMRVESNPSIPFVSIREYNESLVDIVTGRSLQYFGIHESDASADSVSYLYVEQDRAVIASVHDQGTGRVLQSTRIENVDWFVEGVTLFFYARVAARPGRRVNVPTVVQGKLSNTYLEYDQETEELEIDAREEPFRVRHYSGFAEWSGASSAGVTGNFEGWLTDDEAAVPVRGELRIILGSIVIELERWSRNGWNPMPGTATASR